MVDGTVMTKSGPESSRANGMEDILFLCHRLPYPPDKGDKIRSCRWLRWLSERYRVHLGTFIDERRDWARIGAVESLCASSCIRPLGPMRRRVRALNALLAGESLTVACYRDRVLNRWVDHTLANRPVRAALVFSSGMAWYLQGRKGLRRVMDFVDVDSDKWRQYGEYRDGLLRPVYRREATLLAEFERAVAADYDASVLVTDSEARFFRERIASIPERIHAIPNGVDTRYWDPERDYSNPYAASERVAVFVGAMDYWANAQGVCWFARAVWPRVYAARPAARFYVVGAKPARSVRALAREPGIVVTGRVDDVRPYLAYAHVVAAPLLIARGVQNKVLEALAMGKVLVATPEAYEGIERFAGLRGCISGAAEEQAREISRWLGKPSPQWYREGRDHVRERYEWHQALESLGLLLAAGKSGAVPENVAPLYAGGVS